MGIFGNLFNKKTSEIEIGAPVSGLCVPCSEVNDPTFSSDMLGHVIAIKPSDGRIIAPANGTISSVFPTGHAVCMITDDGVEVLIHVGLDTVTLNGECFKIHVENGAKVKKGDLLLEADLEGIRSHGFDTIIPIVISNPSEFKEIHDHTGNVQAGDMIFQITK